MAATYGNEELIQVTPIRSWAEIWRNCRDPRWLIWMLEWVSCSDAELRLFACWCARQSWRIVGEVIYEDMVEMAEQYSLGEAGRQEMATLWQNRQGGAVGSGICGIPKGRSGAAAQLASFQTCRDDAKEAAWQAAIYTTKAAGFKAAEEGVEILLWWRNGEEKRQKGHRKVSFTDTNSSAAEEAEDMAWAEQADGLRQIVGNPMLREDTEMPVPAQTLAYWMTWGFVPEKSMQEEWWFSSDFLNVRVSFKTLVDEYSPSGVVVCTSVDR
jgi:hypothetical protein